MKIKDPFHHLEKLSGILLFLAALLALVISNSPLSSWYHSILSAQASITIGAFELNKPILLWINDGLMTTYFLLVGLEIKREIRRGILSDTTSVLVPAIAACCGLLLPAIIFYAFNHHNPVFLRGWAIPTATDIAFTLGILSLISKKVPLSLKVLLTAIAIFDDIGAIVIIAIFYTSKLSYLSLIFSLVFTISLITFNQMQVKRLSLYIVIGICLWLSVLKSGVHATLAGIILAFTIPDFKVNSLLTRVEHGLHPWCVFCVLPLFAFANSGLSFAHMSLDLFTHPIFLGIALGLIVGKQIGIFLPLLYFVKYKNYLAYDNINTRHIYGLALLCGVGFTMSLFIGALAYKGIDSQLLNLVKLGVVTGSVFSGICGYLVLKHAKTN